jgi:hypothetical protein
MLYLAVTRTWGSNAQKNPVDNHRVPVEKSALQFRYAIFAATRSG